MMMGGDVAFNLKIGPGGNAIYTSGVVHAESAQTSLQNAVVFVLTRTKKFWEDRMNSPGGSLPTSAVGS